MKKNLLMLSIALLGFNALNAQVKVGDNSTTVDVRSLLELESTNKALWLPRLTTTQRDAQTGWKAGMFIYNNTDSCVQMFNGTIWNCLAKGNGTAWQLLGNAGTNSAINFIGTTDDVDVVFKRNNVKAGLLNNNSTAFGVNALNSYTTLGSNNTAIGNSSLKSLTSGYSNVALGHLALRDMVDGVRNTAVGAVAMVFQTGGGWNTMVGQAAMYYTTNRASSYNTGVGYEALARTNGNYNTAIGYGTWDTYDGDSSIFIGSRVGPRAGTSVNKQLNIGDWIYGVSGKIGIGASATNPTNQFHIAGSINPVRLEGLQSGAVTDSIVTTDATGVLRQRSIASIASGSEPWYNKLTGTGATNNTDSVYTMGWVGVGTNSPRAPLQLGATTYLKDNITGGYISNAAIWVAGHGKRVYFGDNGSGAVGGNNGNLNVSVGEWGGYDSDVLELHGKLGVRITTGAFDTVTTMYVNGGCCGNPSSVQGVGIKTVAPTNTLDVNGDARIRTLASGAATDEILTADATGVVRKIDPLTKKYSATLALTPSYVTIDNLNHSLLSSNVFAFAYLYVIGEENGFVNRSFKKYIVAYDGTNYNSTLAENFVQNNGHGNPDVQITSTGQIQVRNSLGALLGTAQVRIEYFTN
jgi:hypothetical protein